MPLAEAIKRAREDTICDIKNAKQLLIYISYNMRRWYRPGDISLELKELNKDMWEISELFPSKRKSAVTLEELDILISTLRQPPLTNSK